MTTASLIQTISQNDPEAGKSRAASAWRGHLFALLLIFALNWVCYLRIINGYFLADDFLHVDYLKKVFAGDWMSLAQNFWGNWMQAEGTTFYRPLISLTLALDYLAFGANAAGFHVSNLFYQTACSLILYFVVSSLTRIFAGHGRGQGLSAYWAGLSAAALFSVNPLHCEVVAWIISRVDSVACMFYLAAFGLHLWAERAAQTAQAKVRTIKNLSLVAFALALCSKEMAAALPPTVMFLHWLLATDENKSPRQRFFYGIKKSLPYWLLFCAYMVLRSLALGTISGGYQGSIGEGLSDTLVKRWLQDGSFMRLLFPLNIDVFGANSGLYKELKLLYMIAAANFILALTFAREKKPALISLLFGLGWFVISLVPTIQVWNLSETLQGSRFAYFATVPLAYLLALLVVPPTVAKWPAFDRFFLPLRLVCLTFFITAFATATNKDNGPWQHAMKELKTFQSAVCLAADNNPGEAIALLNIPQSYRGAHMLYNGATMSVALRPPLAQSDIVDRIYTFEPATFGDADLISISRLRSLIRSAKPPIFYSWDRAAMALKPLDFHVGQFAAKTSELLASPLTLAPDKVALSFPLELSALDIDAIVVRLDSASLAALKVDDKSKDAALQLIFAGESMTLPILKSLENGAITFQVSEHKIWLKQDTVKSLGLKTISCPMALKVTAVESICLDNRAAILKPDGRDLVEGPDGICRVKGPHPTFSYDVTAVDGAAGALCETSKTNSWFEHYTGTLRDVKASEHALSTSTLSKLTGKSVPLSFAGIKDHGFYQIKLAAVDKDGKVIQYFSDPLNFQI